LAKISHNGRLFALGRFLKIAELIRVFVLLFPLNIDCFILAKKGLGNISGDFLTNSSGHTASVLSRARCDVTVVRVLS
jgi:hypothetical protein